MSAATDERNAALREPPAWLAALATCGSLSETTMRVLTDVEAAATGAAGSVVTTQRGTRHGQEGRVKAPRPVTGEHDAKLFATLRELATCGVCFDLAVQPQQMPRCEHAFCKGCIDGWLERGRWTCPLCRARVLPQELRRSGVLSLLTRVIEPRLQEECELHYRGDVE